MGNDFDFVTEYYNWLKDNTFSRMLENGWTEIGTPFMDRHNDGLTIYVKKEGSNITLSDDGYIISDLYTDGVSLSGKKRKELLEYFLASYGVKITNGEMIMSTTKSDYPKSKHMFIQAMLAVNDMFMINGSNVKTIFLDDVTSFFDENDIIYTPGFIAKGSTGLEFNFNFQIAGRTSEILINSFNTINRSNLSTFLFDWLDIKEARQKMSNKQLSGLAIINDAKNDIDSKYLEALSAKGTEYILFSQRNTPENLQKLKAA